MATINIQNATVKRLIRDMGFEAVESYQRRDGSQGETKFTVWTSPNNIPGEGSKVNITGNVSVKVEEYNGVTFARFHVNQPKVMLVDGPQDAPEPEPWPTPAGQQVPF